MSLRALVDLVDHRRERRALARSGGPRHQDQAVGELGEPLHGGGEIQLLQRGHLVRDDAEHGPEALRLDEDVHAKARDALDGVDEVRLLRLFELRPLLVAEQLQQETARLHFREHAEGERRQLSLVADDGNVAGMEVQVARALLRDQPQE